MTLGRIREDTVNEESSTPTKRKRVSKRKVRKNKKRAKYAQLYKLTVNLGVCIQRYYLTIIFHWFICITVILFHVEFIN